MALKDWKKEYAPNKGILFVKDKDTSIHIFTQYSEWGVVFHNGFWHKTKPKTFKTKSAALKFAKSYMRTH